MNQRLQSTAPQELGPFQWLIAQITRCLLELGPKFFGETWKAIARSIVVVSFMRTVEWVWRRIRGRDNPPTRGNSCADNDRNGEARCVPIVVLLQVWKSSKSGATPIAVVASGEEVKPGPNMDFHFDRCSVGPWVVFLSANRRETFRYCLPDDPSTGPIVVRPPRGRGH
jgi:hypothetical protein